MAIQTPHWPCIKRYASLIHCSALDASPGISRRSPYDRESETVSAMASLSMRYPDNPAEGGVRLKSSRRRSSDNHMNEDGVGPPHEIRRSRSNDEDNEEPMDQDDGK